MTFDITKPVKTRDGRDVWIYRTNAPGPYPIHGHIEGCTFPYGWTATGALVDGTDASADLVNVPEKIVRYLNIYRGDLVAPCHPTREQADKSAADGRIACIRVEFEEGRFDP